jgi:glucokinase
MLERIRTRLGRAPDVRRRHRTDLPRAGRPRRPAGGKLSAAEISRRALAGECSLCDDVIEAFCCMLGTMAGNLAVTLGAQGGIYIGGGIVPKLGERFDRSGFRARFEAKGRFNKYLAAVPTWVITAEYPAFVGVSAILSERLAVA